MWCNLSYLNVEPRKLLTFCLPVIFGIVIPQLNSFPINMKFIAHRKLSRLTCSIPWLRTFCLYAVTSSPARSACARESYFAYFLRHIWNQAASNWFLLIGSVGINIPTEILEAAYDIDDLVQIELLVSRDFDVAVVVGVEEVEQTGVDGELELCESGLDLK